ncbi:glycosyltransferase family 4 protein [Helicobacter fennelliae]|uniref:glycosyltransferase family 4 protein n=1 Tax=Helicobacter fennelliae TaxID=215 RepID=UPI000DFF5714|nr:glycosyltransferase family 4 protein [Helicobacter fennelliae]STQ84177.1 Probable poly(glycerol-phosphate) alpha-glucosyltransferase [Helicobacter fennelliae]
MKSIALTVGDLSITGGAERVVVNLAHAFLELGCNVEIISFFQKNKDFPYQINQKIKITIIHHGSEYELKDRYHGFWRKLYFKNFYKIALSYQIKKHYKHIDTFIVSDWTYTPFVKNKNTYYIKIIHCNFVRYNSRNKYFDTLVVLSSSELNLWKQYHKNVKVIPNFLPSIPSVRADSNNKVVLAVGRMDRGDQKGFLRLIDIWNLLAQDTSFTPIFKKWRLYIVGDGELKQEIESKIAVLELSDSIILKPFTKQIEKEYLSASIYALSSHFEGLPMVLLESSAYSLPSVAFDVKSGPSDIIEDLESGFLVTDNDLQGFAERLKLLMSDEALRARFGIKAKQIVQERFGKEIVMKEWKKVLQQT